MPLKARYYVALTAVGCAYVALCRALIALSLQIFDVRTAALSGLGILPLIFLDRDNRMRYLCFTLAMAGLAGLVLHGREYLECSLRRPCIAPPSTGAIIVAGLSYAAYLGAAWGIWLRRVRDLNQP